MADRRSASGAKRMEGAAGREKGEQANDRPQRDHGRVVPAVTPEAWAAGRWSRRGRERPPPRNVGRAVQHFDHARPALATDSDKAKGPVADLLAVIRGRQDILVTVLTDAGRRVAEFACVLVGRGEPRETRTG